MKVDENICSATCISDAVFYSTSFVHVKIPILPRRHSLHEPRRRVHLPNSQRLHQSKMWHRKMPTSRTTNGSDNGTTPDRFIVFWIRGSTVDTVDMKFQDPKYAIHDPWSTIHNLWTKNIFIYPKGRVKKKAKKKEWKKNYRRELKTPEFHLSDLKFLTIMKSEMEKKHVLYIVPQF